MRGYLALAWSSIQANIVYRAHFFFSMLANIFVIVFIYFLWKTIYGEQTMLKGLSFNDVFVSLALSRTVFMMFQTYVDWEMSFSIINGSITQQLIKPTDYQFFQLASKMGELALNFLIIAIPSILTLIFVFHISIPVGWNLLFFSIAVCFSFLMSFTMDFIIGLVSFYTNSIWGISAAKGTIVMLLSGAMIPLNFFPDTFRAIINYLPFRAMFDIPMGMLLSGSMNIQYYINGYSLQIFWILVVGFFSRLLYKQAIKIVTVNGG